MYVLLNEMNAIGMISIEKYLAIYIMSPASTKVLLFLAIVVVNYN